VERTGCLLWWNGTIAAIAVRSPRGVEGTTLSGGLAGQMHGLVALDRHDAVRVRPLWNDRRTEGSATRSGRSDAIADRGDEERALAGFTAQAHVGQRHEPDVWSRIAHILLPKDLVGSG
jgi:xylulokinase